jgi:GNAT superfamily N-acetyltransferase
MPLIMKKGVTISSLTQYRFNDAVRVVLEANLDTKEEIEHHLKHINAHWVALDKDEVVGVIGWYQDNVNYATEAMGKLFPGKDAYWVGFFAVNKLYRNQGIGKNLLCALEDYLKNANIFKLWVSSVPETESYYKKCGFKLFISGKINGNEKKFMVKEI